MTRVAVGLAGPFRLPAGACDTHCHVFGPGEHFPYSPARRYDPVDCPKETVFARHAALGIDRAVIVQATAHGLDNAAMLDALRQRPSTTRGVAAVDDSVTERMLLDMHEAGVRGVRFNFVRSLGDCPDPAQFQRVIARIRPLGWHVVLHVKGAELLDLSETLRALPVPFVIDHFGRVDAAAGVEQPAFVTLLELARLEDAWIKLSAPERMCNHPYGAALPYLRALVDVRPDRMLWGTDFPHPNLSTPVDEADLIDLIPQYARDEAAWHQLLVANPCQLYGFTPDIGDRDA